MQLTFACPSCGKEYDAPWSMAGKRAYCRRCDHEFVVPAPFERKPPRSSEAIPVLNVPESEPPVPAHAPRKVRSVGPPPTEVLEALRAGSRPRPTSQTTQMEVPPPAGPPTPPSAPRTRANSASRTTRIEDAERYMTWDSPAPRSRKPAASRPPARPPWLIPAIAGGGVALLLAVNVGLYLAFVGGQRADRADPVAPSTAQPAGPAIPPVVAASAGADAAGPGPADVEASPSRPARKPAQAARPIAKAPDRAMDTAEIVAKYEPSVALIKGKKGIGTGFIARAGIVATNAHVIDGQRAKDLEIRFPSAEEGQQGPYPARLLYQDKDRDLALLAVATDLPPVRVAEGYKFRKGEDVTVIGNPGVGGRLILENAISRGIVSSMAKLNGRTFLQLGIAINPGNSGGPVFDPKGRVIGVVTLKTISQEGLAFAIPAEDLLSALETAESVAAGDPGQ